MANFPYYTNLPTSAEINKQWMQKTQPGIVPDPQPPVKRGIGLEGAMGLASGAIGLGSMYGDMVNQRLNFDTNLAPSQMSPDEMPTYTAGNLAGQLSGAKAQGATGGEIASGALQGASAGAALGPVGAGVGALVGGVTSLLGGRRRKKKQQKEIDQATQQLRSAQQTYNTQEQDFQQRQNVQEDYLQRLNNDRMMNLYKAKRF